RVGGGSLEVFAGLHALGLPEGPSIEFGRERHDVTKRLELAVSIRLPLRGQLDADALSERPDCLGKAEPIVTHDEAERVAAGAAAEAVEDAALRIDREGRGLLGVERTESLPMLAGALQVHDLPDELHDIEPRADLVEELRTEVHLRIAPGPRRWRPPRLPAGRRHGPPSRARAPSA